MAKYGTFKYGTKKYGATPTPIPVPPAPRQLKYKIGTVLYEYIQAPNTIPWYNDQQYVVRKYEPGKMQYMLTGTKDNYPRFYTQDQIDLIFRIRRNG